mgnify:CR=1 FL=1
MDDTDRELLTRFARERSEAAFHELVRRHAAMVLATARRIVPDARLAEEVAQNVFVLLTRKAAELDPSQSVAGWIYQATRHCAFNQRRSEHRRQQRELTAALMQPDESGPPRERFLDELEHALTALPAEDRDALVIRFLEDRPLREVGRELGVSEDAARKRVGRALERLREIFARRGITATVGSLTTLLLAEAGAAVPAGLTAALASTALAQSATTTTLIHQGTLATMKAINLKFAGTVVATAILTGTAVYLVQRPVIERLRVETQALHELRGQLDSERQQHVAAVRSREQQLDALRSTVNDLPRLRAEVDRLTRALGEQTRLAQQLAAGPAPAATPSTPASAGEPAEEDWKQGAARIRAKMFGIGGPPTAEEIQWLRDAQPRIEQMERNPGEFAGFQSELIKATVPGLDDARQRQIADIIRQTYEAAVAQGLDLPSKPPVEAADWVARRHALDRLATEAVQALLEPSERGQFDRRFLGVMGVDLGIGVDPSNYPPGFLGDPPGGE